MADIGSWCSPSLDHKYSGLAPKRLIVCANTAAQGACCQVEDGRVPSSLGACIRALDHIGAAAIADFDAVTRTKYDTVCARVASLRDLYDITQLPGTPRESEAYKTALAKCRADYAAYRASLRS